MPPEVSSRVADEAPRRGGWTAWPLVALAALPLAVTAVVTRRVLTGNSALYGELPGGLPGRERVGVLLTYTTHDVSLMVPLLALASLLWLARRGTRRPPASAALWCGAVLAAVVGVMALGQSALVGYLLTSKPTDENDLGFLGPNASLLELFGARAATSLVLAALAIGLAVGLVSVARKLEVSADVLLDEQPREPDLSPAAPQEHGPEPAAGADADPHARYRRPS